jgi:hypothetical protein
MKSNDLSNSKEGISSSVSVITYPAKNVQVFMESEVSLSHPQEPTTGPQPHINFFVEFFRWSIRSDPRNFR